MSRQLNLKVLDAIDQNDAQKVLKYSKTVDPKCEHEYVDRAVRLEHMECLQILMAANWPGVWSGTGLTQAVAHHHTDCIELLFDHTSTEGKYAAFHAAIKAKNTGFLTMFIPKIPRNSTNWFTVFDTLMTAKRTDLVELALETSNWVAILQRNCDKPRAARYLKIFEELDIKRQKSKILKNIDANPAPTPLRKM